MLWKVDHQSSQSLHDQIAGLARRSIVSGDLAPGERLAPSRELAEGLGVNVHTLLRAFQTLRDEGLLEIRRGRGTTVTGKAPSLVGYSELANKLVTEARRAGLANAQILELVKVHL
jgi:DNA-binding transcriptional regulator YhcF (GntR family)